MRREPTTNSFEELPEFLAARTYVRCVDRLFQTLPPSAQWRLLEPVLSAAVAIGTGIACFHGHPEPPVRFSPEEREKSRQRALEGIRLSRERLDEIARIPGADRAELLVARELLDRIEGSVRLAERPG